MNSQLDMTLMALSDPTRRAILESLSKGEARVTELAKPFPISLNAVSKHIRVLEKAKLVIRRKDGREHLLSYNYETLDLAADWIESQRSLWKHRLQVLDTILQEENL